MLAPNNYCRWNLDTLLHFRIKNTGKTMDYQGESALKKAMTVLTAGKVIVTVF